MTEELLGVFKICLLALLYLFFARVLWAVWSEVRPSPVRTADPRNQAQLPADPTLPTVPAGGNGGPRPGKGRGGRVARMTVIEPKARKGLVFAVNTELTIGRADGCTVCIPDDGFISQLHARVFTQDGEVFVEDLRSTNGSYLNGQRLTRVMPVGKGDRLQMGNTVLEAD